MAQIVTDFPIAHAQKKVHKFDQVADRGDAPFGVDFWGISL